MCSFRLTRLIASIWASRRRTVGFLAGINKLNSSKGDNQPHDAPSEASIDVW